MRRILRIAASGRSCPSAGDYLCLRIAHYPRYARCDDIARVSAAMGLRILYRFSPFRISRFIFPTPLDVAVHRI